MMTDVKLPQKMVLQLVRHLNQLLENTSMPTEAEWHLMRSDLLGMALQQLSGQMDNGQWLILDSKVFFECHRIRRKYAPDSSFEEHAVSKEVAESLEKSLVDNAAIWKELADK